MKPKQFIKKAFSLLPVLLLLLGMSVTAFAAQAQVTFESGKLIAFQPGSVYTDSDLFGSFQDVMPGDTRSREITVSNRSDDCDFIKVYLRAVPHDESSNPISEKVLEQLRSDERRGETDELAYMADFLSQLSVTVENGAEQIADGTLDSLGGLAENVYLGQLRQGESLQLRVTLHLPIEMGNEYAGRIGEVDWVFVVEGFDDPAPPQDDSRLTVRKVWVDDGRGRPEQVTVQLLRDGEVYDEVQLSRSNHWVYTWDQLDEEYRWRVVEVDVPDGYEVSYTTQGSLTTITNTQEDAEDWSEPDQPDQPLRPVAVVKPAQKVRLQVIKRWEVEGGNHPDSVQVTLYNREKAVESVRLGEWNNWSYCWKNLPQDGDWQVLETDIPKGWVPSYSEQDGVVTITNAKSLIQTGQIKLPVPVLGVLGCALVGYGIYKMRKKRKNEGA